MLLFKAVCAMKYLLFIEKIWILEELAMHRAVSQSKVRETSHRLLSMGQLQVWKQNKSQKYTLS